MEKFDAKKEIENIVTFIQNYYKKHHLGGAVLGLSGGKDSAVVLALLVKALGKENVIALTMPCHSFKKDQELANMVATYYGVKVFNVDLSPTFDLLKDTIIKSNNNVGDMDCYNSDINLKPRLRMATLYYYAAMLSSLNKKTYLVAGTNNKSELYVGYFTKGGDNSVDFNLIADFTVAEVIKLGEELKVPDKVLYRVPADGLTDLTDEEKLQVTYEEIAKVMNNEKVSSDSAKKIKKLHQNNLHKFKIVTYRRKK